MRPQVCNTNTTIRW